MGVEFEDYYSVLGVDRDASQDEIQKAYKKLARKYHPDVSDEPDTEEKFKEVNEAYQVLKDPEQRAKYDRLGRNFKAGQEVNPPPGWENVHVNVGGAGGFEDIFGGGSPGGGGPGGGAGPGGFSDFFEAFFGGGMGGAGQRARTGGRRRQRPRQKGRSHRARLKVSLEDVYFNRQKTITLPVERMSASGRPVQERKTYTVTIPPGTKEGSTIRLAGEGEEGPGGGQPGDVLLEIEIADHPRFEVEGFDLYTEAHIAPWEAALGAKIEVPTVEGSAKVTVPAGSQSGRKLRLKGKGMSNDGGGDGDLYVELQIQVPEQLSERERELYEQLRDVSDFSPRG